ncbi:MAG: hypothetical protein ACRENE_14670, partial [Polyangiaceae bacterium]
AQQPREPTVRECLAASNASAKLRSEHKLREAREKLVVCVSSSCPSEIREECTRRMDRVTTALPSVVFRRSTARGTSCPP